MFPGLTTYVRRDCGNQRSRVLSQWASGLSFGDWQLLSSGKYLDRSTHLSHTQIPYPGTHMSALAQPCFPFLVFSSGRRGPLHSGHRTSEPRPGHTAAPLRWHTAHSTHRRPAPCLRGSLQALGGRGAVSTPCSPHPPPTAAATRGAGGAVRGRCPVQHIYTHTGKTVPCCWRASEVRGSEVTTRWDTAESQWTGKWLHKERWPPWCPAVLYQRVTCFASSEF